MLKIKDSVDLKELEKYGFRYQGETSMCYEGYKYLSKTENDFYPCMRCFVYSFDRHIIVNSTEFEILYDLILNGLVEKISNEI